MDSKKAEIHYLLMWRRTETEVNRKLSLKTYKAFCRIAVEVVSSYVWNEKIESVCGRKKRLLDERGENGFNSIQMFRVPQCIQKINTGMPVMWRGDEKG